MRLYPALVASIAAACILFRLTEPVDRPGLGQWLNAFHLAPPTLRTVVRSVLLFCKTGTDVGLNPAIWSLAYELRFSVVFPFLALLISRRPLLLSAILMILYLGCKYWVATHGLDRHVILNGTWTGAAMITLLYITVFATGMILAMVAQRLPELDTLRALIATTVSVFMLLALWNEMLLSLSTCLLIWAAWSNNAVSAVLERGFARWAGRISYSLYLLHMLSLYYCVHILYLRHGLILCLAVSILVAILAAMVCERWIERPGIALGRRLARRLRQSRHAEKASQAG